MIGDRHGAAGFPAGQRIEIYDIAGNSWTNSGIVPLQAGWGGITELSSIVWADNDTIWAWIRNFDSTITRCVRYTISTDTWDVFANSLGVYAPRTVAIIGDGSIIYGLGGAGDRALIRYTIATDAYADLGTIGAGLERKYAYDQDKLWFGNTTTLRLGYVDMADLSVNQDIFDEDTERAAGYPASVGIEDGLLATIGHSLTISPWLRSTGAFLPLVQTNPATEVT